MDAASLRPLGVGEMLDVAIKLYRRRFPTLLKAVAVPIAPMYALFAVLQLSLMPSPEDLEPIESFDPATGEPQFDVSVLWAIVAGALLFGVVYFVASQVATAACFKVVSAAYLGDEVDWKPSLRFVLGRLGSLLWLSFLLFGALALGTLLCLVPGIYLYFAFGVAVPVLLVENVRGTRALKRSRSLVKGRWWPVFAVIVLGIFMAQIVSSVLSGVINLSLGATGSDTAAVIGNSIASTLAAAIVTPFTAAVVTVVYFDLRVRKEGFDVELLASQLGVAPSERPRYFPPPPPPPPAPGAQPPFWPPPPGWRPPDA